MFLKINCKYSKDVAYCTNNKIKKSLFGMGARCCVEYHDKVCSIKEVKTIKGSPPPSPQKKY